MTAAQFDDSLDFLRHCISSLKSCKPNEIANESRILANQINNCKAMKLARKNESREIRRKNLIEEAASVIAGRLVAAK